MSPEASAKHIANLIKESRSTMVFTGAGMSTESGLPDFRSNGGLWDGKDPMKISHVKMLTDNARSICSFYKDRARDAFGCKPNRGHQILAEWETQGKVVGIATQNIDGYHQLAGSQAVYELHGNLTFRCEFCGKKMTAKEYIDDPRDRFYDCEELECKDIEAIIRPNVILFGEALDSDMFSKAERQFKRAELTIILGTSCSVYPAANLPFTTIEGGGKVVIINRTKTEMDLHADYIINDWGITKSLETIDKILKKK